MKAIGVVRRIDELGRIVIPKELRKTMRIKEGDSLEIFIDGAEKVVLKKYSPVQNIYEIVGEFVDSVYEANKVDIIITDSEKVIAVGGKLKDALLNKKISSYLDDRIRNRNTQLIERGSNFELVDNVKISKPLLIKSIHVYGDILGSVIVIGENAITDVEKTILELGTTFFNKYLEG